MSAPEWLDLPIPPWLNTHASVRDDPKTLRDLDPVEWLDVIVAERTVELDGRHTITHMERLQFSVPRERLYNVVLMVAVFYSMIHGRAPSTILINDGLAHQKATALGFTTASRRDRRLAQKRRDRGPAGRDVQTVPIDREKLFEALAPMGKVENIWHGSDLPFLPPFDRWPESIREPGPPPPDPLDS
jgi:hypothetical protein